MFTFTDKLQFVQQGSGTVHSLNTTFHITLVNGNATNFDFGIFETPEEG